MTFEESVRDRLSKFMFDDQVESIISKCKEEIEAFGLSRWDEDTEHYPDVVLALLWLNVKAIAAAWTKENKPQAWFLPVLES